MMPLFPHVMLVRALALGFALLALGANLPARAQACAGVTVTGSDDGVVRCESGTTIIDRYSGQGDNTASGGGALVMNMTVRPNPPSPQPNWHNFSRMDFDFTGMSARATVNVTNDAIWRLDANSTVPDANFDVVIRDRGALVFGPVNDSTFVVTPLQGANTVFYEAPGATLVNEGLVVVGQGHSQTEGRVEGLARFEHQGRMLMGAHSDGFNLLAQPLTAIGSDQGLNRGSRQGSAASSGLRNNFGVVSNRTDSYTDDVLVMPGTTWVGVGGEVWMDTDLSAGRSQLSCARDPASGALPAADCLSLPGGATEGVTPMLFVDRLPFDRGRFIPGQKVVVVEVAGGNSAQGHFVVSPRQPGYSPLFGGSWARGLFQYAIVYDEADQTHALVSMINDNAHQQAQVSATATDLWRLSTDGAADRAAGIAQPGPRDEGQLWVVLARQSADRSTATVEQAEGQAFSFANDGRRQDLATNFGLDLLSGGSGERRWTLGFMTGYLRAKQSYDPSPNQQEYNGWHYGLYAGRRHGRAWLSAVANVTALTLRQAVPGFDFKPADTLASNDLQSLGLRVDGGWQWALSDAITLTPMAGLTYVTTTVEDLTILPDDSKRKGLRVDWDATDAIRATAGMKLDAAMRLGRFNAGVELTARLWQELDGEAQAQIFNEAFPEDAPIPLQDRFDGSFAELNAGVRLSSAGGAFSSYLRVGTSQGDDYDTLSAAAGASYHW